jgi:uncharacterized protein (TIGR02246 family)
MKRSTLQIGGLFVAVNSIVLQASSAAESSALDQEIQQSARTFVEAFDSGNAEAVAALWTDDGEYSVGHSIVKGRLAIQRLYEEFFTAHPGARMEVKIDSVRMLAPTVAIEQGTAYVSNSPNGMPSESTYTAVHIRQDNKWLMTSVHESETPLAHGGRGLQELDWLVGSWAAEGGATKVEMKFDWIANKNFLRCDTIVNTEDGPTFGGMQVIGRDPLTGRIVSWFFNADGGHGYGVWSREGSHWLIQTEGAAADGVPTSATNVLYHPDENVASWQSINRTFAESALPDAKEIVIERVAKNEPENK